MDRFQQAALSDPLLVVVGDIITAPSCEICGCTLGPEVQAWWTGPDQNAPEGEWPCAHPDCAEWEMGEECRTGAEPLSLRKFR